MAHPSSPDSGTPDSRLAAAGDLAMLASQFEAVPDPDAMMQLIVARGRQLIAGSGFAALRCRSHARWSTAAAADINSHRYAELQVAFNQQCSIVAPPRGEVDQGAASRLEVRTVRPDAHLSTLGIRRIIVAPIGVAKVVFGTFNWYLRHDIDPDTVDRARGFARHASVAYLHARERRELVEACASRGLIGQAQGILMVTLGIDAAAAFAALRRRSQQENQKLSHVAAELVSVGRFEADVRERFGQGS